MLSMLWARRGTKFNVGYLYKKGTGIFLNIKVKPQSNKTMMRGCDKDELLIDLEQPAENNKANE